jgi:hypothetical protein
MPNILILVWQNKEGSGDPDVEVRIPAGLAKWVPRLMKLVSRKTRETTWGEDIDFDAMFADLEKLVKEAAEGGLTELMTVKTKDAYVKMTVEK